MEKVIITNVAVGDHDITVEFDITEGLEKYINKHQPFKCSYSDDISNVPGSVAVIPFICDVLPVIWLTNSELYVDSLDADFYHSIDNIKSGYEQMYPDMSFSGKVNVENIVSNVRTDTDGLCGTFFSGGVDAFCTLLRHIDERPVLITIWGADVPLSQNDGWNVVKRQVCEVGQSYGLDYSFVKSNFRQVVNEYAGNDLVKDSGDMWWHGFQHGIGIISHAAPIAFVRGLSTVYIASSFSQDQKGHYKCASDPMIDNAVNFCGTKVSHDAYELDRQQKVDFLCLESKMRNLPVSLRVCWVHTDGHNCCLCEKCLRTIFEIYAAGDLPENYGFDFSGKNMRDARYIVLAGYIGYLHSVWHYTQSILCEDANIKLPEWATWIRSVDFHTDSRKQYVSKYRKIRQGDAHIKDKIAFEVYKFLNL